MLQEVRFCLKIRGTIDTCGEMLTLTCQGNLRVRDGTQFSVNINITINAVTLDLSGLELDKGLEDGCLVHGLKWHNERLLK